MTQKVISYQVADAINIKEFAAAYNKVLYYNDPAELFYKLDTDQYVYVFKYGAVCFLNFSKEKIEDFLQFLKPYCRNLFTTNFTDEFLVESGVKDVRVGFNKIEIPSADIEVLRLVMLNVSQSVAIDYYEDQTGKLLTETNYYTQRLEQKGRLGIQSKKLKKYIGRTLLLRNRIAENIYVFDSPPQTWENENLNKIDADLKRTFDLHVRVRSIHEWLNIVRDNLELFRGLLQNRNSTILEWIIILLILVEVIDMLIKKFLND